MSTLSNLIEKPGASLLKPKGSSAFSQIRVINIAFTGSQITQAKTSAYVNVNFGVKCINVMQIICNTTGTTAPGTANAYGMLNSNMVPNAGILGAVYMNNGYPSASFGVKHYFRQPIMVNGNYDFFFLNSLGASLGMQAGQTWDFSIIVEFICDSSGQEPVTSS